MLRGNVTSGGSQNPQGTEPGAEPVWSQVLPQATLKLLASNASMCIVDSHIFGHCKHRGATFCFLGRSEQDRPVQDNAKSQLFI